MRIIFATHNKGKLREIREIFSDISSDILSKDELGVMGEAEESGESFKENSELKALYVYNELKKTGKLQEGDIVMADDSGLCIDFLGGKPGVYSSRFLGEDTDYSIKNQRIIEMLIEAKGEERRACFKCDIAAVRSDGEIIHEEGVLSGHIASKAMGEDGFGYDPIFYLPSYSKTAAEIDFEEKNRISHRGKALEKIKNSLIRSLK